MSLNYEFVVEQVNRLAEPGSRMLDFGCGGGQIIQAALAAGHDAYGADKSDAPEESYGVWASMAHAAACKDRIVGIGADDRIPFDDNTFDVVTANQVFEHIRDFAQPLAEIHRVLRPGGYFVNLFPTSDYWLEGHTKAWFAHHFFERPAAFRSYLTFSDMIGWSTRQAYQTRDQWVTHQVKYLPLNTFYKSVREVEQLFSQYFEILPGEEARWMRHRVNHHQTLARLAWLIEPKTADPILKFACAKLAGRVFILKNRN